MKMRVGVFSPNDPRPWVREENIEVMLLHEKSLVETLKAEGIEVVRGGEGFPKNDQIAWNTQLVRDHIKNIAKKKPEALIINQGSWTFPYDSVDAVKAFMRETEDISRVIMFSYKDTRYPGLVAGMAAGGGLKRIGIPFSSCYGIIDKDEETKKWLLDILNFYKKRSDSEKVVKKAISQLGVQKYLSLGGMALKMPTTTADVDLWQKLFGVSYEALDQSEMKIRALKMVDWKGKPGESEYVIKDERLKAAINYLWVKKHGTFDFSRDKLKNINKFVYQMSFYYASLDLAKEYGITFLGVKCQDEISANECTACLVTAFLSNDVGPDGCVKQIYPAACENDMDSALTQLWLYLLSGKPAGFGDFRDVDGDILAIVNCGQHPPFFFGAPEEDSVRKLDYVEYMGQEIFYAAGGSSVRGRTPGGHKMTIARLGRENLRYQLVATVMNTIDVSPEEHNNYDPSWPIIRGKVPIPGKVLIDIWPCNHLGFTYGDYTPQLVEMAQRLDIGFRIYDEKGREYSKAT